MTDDPRAPIDAADAVWPNVTLDRIDGVFVYADRGEPEPMTDEDLAEIEARADAATPGPWTLLSNGIYSQAPSGKVDLTGGALVHGYVLETYPWFDSGDAAIEVSAENRAFLLHAREDIPRLLAEIRRLKAEAAEREEAHGLELIHQAAWS